MTKKQIEAALKGLGYTISAMNDRYSYGNDTGGYKIFHKDTIAELKADAKKNGDYVDDYLNEDDNADNYVEYATDEMPFCCGTTVIGSFGLLNTGLNKKSKNNLYEATKLMIAYAFLNEKGTFKKGKSPAVMQLFFTSNGKNGWEIAEQALAEQTDQFKLVATTKNPNSSSILKTYTAIYN